MVANDLDWKKIYELLAVSDLRKVLFDKLLTKEAQIFVDFLGYFGKCLRLSKT